MKTIKVAINGRANVVSFKGESIRFNAECVRITIGNGENQETVALFPIQSLLGIWFEEIENLKA